jgi:Carboxypeptidase regulatory-like domain
MTARLGIAARVMAGLMLAGWPASARAQAEAGPMDPAAPQALGRVVAAGSGPAGPTLLASGGYGYTGSVLGMGDAHHRVAGSLALDDRLLPWLDLAVRLDGRFDVHTFAARPTDDGLIGDPRVYARVDHGWAGGLRLGARAGLWLPGGDAPSVDAAALSPELLGMASYAPPGGSIAVTANAGYRLDRSARSAPESARLSPGDRLALEVSAFDELLAGLAVTAGRGRTQAFVEASADLLLGTGAPALKTSPMFIGGGARFAVTPAWRLEAELEVSPSSRPDVSASAPLVPIPPRVAGWLGVSYRFRASPPPHPAPPPPAPVVVPDPKTPEPAPVAVPPPAAQAEPPPPVAPAPPRLPGGQIRGLVRSLRGTALAADIAVEPATAAPGTDPAPEPKRIRTEAGRFQIDVAPGRYRVTIEAAGYATQVRNVDVEDDGVTLLNVDLRTER